MTDSVENFLEHYGVRGMKWGVRRRSGGRSSSTAPDTGKTPRAVAVPSAAAAKATVAKPAWQSAPKQKVSRSAKSSPKMASEDAIVFNALREKAKKGGIQALSNDEIRVLTTRAKAIDEFKRSMPAPQKTKKQKLVKFVVDDILLTTGKQLAKDVTKHKMSEALRKGNHLPAKDKDKDDKKDSSKKD